MGSQGMLERVDPARLALRLARPGVDLDPLKCARALKRIKNVNPQKTRVVVDVDEAGALALLHEFSRDYYVIEVWLLASRPGAELARFLRPPLAVLDQEGVRTVALRGLGYDVDPESLSEIGFASGAPLVVLSAQVDKTGGLSGGAGSAALPPEVTWVEYSDAGEEVFRELHAQVFSGNTPESLEFHRDWFRAILNGTYGPFRADWCVGALVQGIPAGYIVAVPVGNGCAELVAAGVLKPYRNMGLGASLLGRVTSVVAASGVTILRALVQEDNLVVIAALLRRGFRVLSRRPQYLRRRA